MGGPDLLSCARQEASRLVRALRLPAIVTNKVDGDQDGIHAESLEIRRTAFDAENAELPDEPGDMTSAVDVDRGRGADMGSMNIRVLRGEWPGKTDAEAAKEYARQWNVYAIVAYKNSPDEPDFTDFATCNSGYDIDRYFDSQHCHDVVVLYRRE